MPGPPLSLALEMLLSPSFNKRVNILQSNQLNIRRFGLKILKNSISTRIANVPHFSFSVVFQLKTPIFSSEFSANYFPCLD